MNIQQRDTAKIVMKSTTVKMITATNAHCFMLSISNGQICHQEGSKCRWIQKNFSHFQSQFRHC